MSNATGTQTPRFADGAEKQAWEATHVGALQAAFSAERGAQDPTARIAHLEAVAERQADELRITVLKLEAEKAETARLRAALARKGEYADRVTQERDQLERALAEALDD
jgi:hypothetical protein